MLCQLLAVFLQLGEAIERIGAVQFAGVDQAPPATLHILREFDPTGHRGRPVMSATHEVTPPSGLVLVSKDLAIADNTTRLPKAVLGFVTAVPEPLFCYVLHFIERQAIEPVVRQNHIRLKKLTFR